VSHFGAKNAVLAGKSPVVATVHDLIPNDVPLSPDYYRIHPARRRWLNPVYWRFLKMCDHLITTSESTKRDAVRILNFKPERISVVPYGVEGRRFQPTVRKTYHSPKKVLYIGALDPGKGIFNLVQAFRRVTEELSEVELCIGGRGNQFAALKRMVGALGIANKVKFLGFVPNEELPYYYSSSDLFVFPSYYGFHLMDLDAMASGLPVVAGNVRDAPEYIGRAGLLVNPWQISELSGAIIKLLTDEDLYTQMSQEAITRASLFTTERMGNLTLEVYQRILSEDRP
jgi:glycosyltransferase involved in cell wall biosynthesis